MGKVISVEVNVAEILGMMDDSDIKREAEHRDVDFSAGRLNEAFADGMAEAYAGERDYAITAINQIRVGKYEDAIVTLERAFLPAWEDQSACEARYREVMGRA